MMLSAIEWRITGRCNEDCVYCYGPKKDVHPLDEELYGICRVLSTSPVPVIRFSGGEPLLIKGIAEIFATLKEAGKTVVLSTNARRFTKLRPSIEKSLDKINVSLDGYDEETHSINGRRSAGFVGAIEALNDLRTTPPSYPVKVGTVLTSRNIAVPDLLPKMFDLLQQYPVDRWKVYQYIPEGPIVDDVLRVDDTIYRAVTQSFLERIGDRVDRPQVEFSSASDRDRAYFIVQPKGDVIIPVGDNWKTDEVRLGNVLTDKMEDLIAKWQTIAKEENHQRNISVMRPRDNSLDSIDRIILFEVDRDPTIDVTRLASLAHERTDIVEARLNRLFKNGIIRYSMPIINLERLGFGVYLVDITLRDASAKQDVIDRFRSHGNVGWLVSTTDPRIILAAVFARSGMHCNRIVGHVADSLGSSLESIEVSDVYEKFVLGQRYLTIEDRVTDFVFDHSHIAFVGEEAQDLADEERSVLASLRELRSTSLSIIAEQSGIARDRLDLLIADLRRRGIIVKFQPVYDVKKLGYRWFLVALRTRWLEGTQRVRFLDFLHALTRVVHINCMFGNWHLNFEVHAKDEKEVERILEDMREQFPETIVEVAVREIDEEYKFNFLADAVIEGAET